LHHFLLRHETHLCQTVAAILADSVERLQETGTLYLGESAIISEASNSTVTSIINFTGSITMDGHYSRIQHSDPYGTWDIVIVQATIKIVLKDL